MCAISARRGDENGEFMVQQFVCASASRLVQSSEQLYEPVRSVHLEGYTQTIIVTHVVTVKSFLYAKARFLRRVATKHNI